MVTKGEIRTANLEEREWQNNQAEWRPFIAENGTDHKVPPLKNNSDNSCPLCGQKGFDWHCINCGWPD
jgi:hypothetical protein